MSENSSKKFWTGWFKNDWGVVGAIFFSLAALIGPSFLLEPLIPALSSILPFSENDRLSIFRILLELIAILFIAGIIKVYHRSLQDIGISRVKLIHAGKAALGFGVYFVLTILLYLITTWLLPIDQSQPQNIGYSGLNGVGLIIAFLALVVLTPIAEEVIFRGFMFRGLRRRMPFWPAAVIVSILFGLAHWQWNVGIDVFALSLIACYLREESKSLWPSIFLHAIKNSVAFYMLYLYNGI